MTGCIRTARNDIHPAGERSMQPIDRVDAIDDFSSQDTAEPRADASAMVRQLSAATGTNEDRIAAAFDDVQGSEIDGIKRGFKVLADVIDAGGSVDHVQAEFRARGSSEAGIDFRTSMILSYTAQ
jgi:hypothetical protein